VHLDPWVIVARLGVGFVVGLTGMRGGGASRGSVVVLVLSALKLLDTPNPLILVAALVALGIAIWIVIRSVVRRDGAIVGV